METAMSTSGESRPRAPTKLRWWLGIGMKGLAFEYLFWYTPFADLAKTQST